MARKQADGAGSIRKRTDGRYEVRCTIGYDPGSGKRISKSAYAKSKKEAREKLTELTRAVDQGTFMESARTTLGLWLDEWLETYSKGRVKPYTYDTYFRIIRNHIKPALGAVRLCDLTGTMLQRFYNSLLRDKNLSPKNAPSICGAHGSLYPRGFVEVDDLSFSDSPRKNRRVGQIVGQTFREKL